MSPAISRAAGRLADNTLLTAAARLLMVLGLPVTLGIVGWLASTMLSLVEARTDLTRRLEQVERVTREGAQDDRAVATRLGAVEVGQARIEATQQATLRTVERIERQLDGSRRP